ncbi:Iron-sulfur cluster assembly protein SufD [hydrothermal vent metagenome]|uniref:Iron-sulfur cluster assembly protein SufD n=1 Tax=hydrothermal vent metagenome TaxID=652676 RepID=A0A3B0VZ32_9ZZZZ
MSKKNARKVSPMAQAAIEHYVDLSKRLNQTEACSEVVNARQCAQAILLERAFPTQRDEAWQYTKLVNFVQKRFEVAIDDTVSSVDLDALQKFLPPLLPTFKIIKLVFVDGQFSAALSSDLLNLPKGLTIRLTQSLLNDAKAVAPFLSAEDVLSANAFVGLNQALLHDGFEACVAKNSSIDAPLFVVNIQSQSNQLSTLTNQVHVAENAELTLIQQFVSLDGIEACTNAVTNVEVAKSARVRQVILQQQAEASFYFHHQFVSQADNSDFNTFYAGMGSVLSRHQNVLLMNGEHIESSQNSACLAHQKQVVDSRTDTEHNQVWGASRQLHKYVLADSAVGVFNGMIKVAREAQKTDGQMDNKNLLLSGLAKMNSKPQLEIYADDVKCSHGCATGQINHDQIFYLQARGIPKNQAIEMVTKAFLMEPVETINCLEVRQWVGRLLSNALLEGGYFSKGITSCQTH